MNTRRLTTNKLKLPFCALENRLYNLLKAPFNYEIHSYGKIFLLSEGVYLKGRRNVGVKVFNDKGSWVNSFNSIKDCALIYNLHPRIIDRKFNTGNFLLFNKKNIYLNELFNILE